ncbi:unnamed protein product, partial [Medioppia subpectinata]
MNGKEMTKNEAMNDTNGSISDPNLKKCDTKSPFQRNTSDRRSRASIRQIERRVSTTSVQSRGGWGNKWVSIELCWTECWNRQCFHTWPIKMAGVLFSYHTS